jgi:hypothetical protein
MVALFNKLGSVPHAKRDAILKSYHEILSVLTAKAMCNYYTVDDNTVVMVFE